MYILYLLPMIATNAICTWTDTMIIFIVMIAYVAFIAIIVRIAIIATIAINIMDAIINQNILIAFITFIAMIAMIAIHILDTIYVTCTYATIVNKCNICTYNVCIYLQ